MGQLAIDPDSGRHGNAVAQLPFRLRIGAIGHRSIDDAGKLAERCVDLIKKRLADDLKLREDIAGPTPTRLAVVTSLADGADRLLAKLILDQPDAQLYATLPFAAREFRETLESDAARRDFDSLLARDPNPQVISGNVQNTEGSRAKAYRECARNVVDHCDVLVAVWDGQPARGRGGTAETIAYARSRKRPLFLVPADGEGEIQFEAGAGLDVSALAGLDFFNRKQSIAPPPSIQSPLADAFEIATPLRTAIESVLLQPYELADKTAMRNQGRFYKAGQAIYVCASAAVLCVAIAAVYGVHWLFAMEAALLVVVLGSFLFALMAKLQDRWMASRFFAERLRSGFYLAACGLHPVPIDVPPHLGLAHRADDWPVRAFNEIWRRMPPLPATSDRPVEQLRDFVRTRWIQDQRAFHKKRGHQFHASAKYWELFGLSCFGATLLIAIVHAVTHLPDALDQLTTVLAIALPAAGAASAGYRAYREFERLAKRNEHTASLLDDLDQRMSTVATTEEVADLVREMELLALRETQDWLMLVRFVKPEPV